MIFDAGTRAWKAGLFGRQGALRLAAGDVEGARRCLRMGDAVLGRPVTRRRAVVEPPRVGGQATRRISREEAKYAIARNLVGRGLDATKAAAHAVRVTQAGNRERLPFTIGRSS